MLSRWSFSCLSRRPLTCCLWCCGGPLKGAVRSRASLTKWFLIITTVRQRAFPSWCTTGLSNFTLQTHQSCDKGYLGHLGVPALRVGCPLSIFTQDLLKINALLVATCFGRMCRSRPYVWTVWVAAATEKVTRRRGQSGSVLLNRDELWPLWPSQHRMS